MAQQQYSMPAGPTFPHPQTTPLPAGSQAFSLPPNKRQRLSPDPRPQSPSTYNHNQSLYGITPNPGTPSSTAASPQFNNISLPTPNLYNTPYGNGSTTTAPSTPTINLPSQLSFSNPIQNPSLAQNPARDVNMQPNGSFTSLHGGNSFQNNFNSLSPNGAGMMGPPSKPVDRDSANDDQMDVIANAGIDVRAEESFAMSFYSGSITSQPTFSQPGPNSTGHAFSQFSPGDASSFYGAGPANQNGQAIGGATQDALQNEAADKAWAEAASKLARSRQHELAHPHMEVRAVWRRMDKIASENGLTLNTEPGNLPTLKMPHEFRSDLTVQTAPGPNGIMMSTGGDFLPGDSPLTDQLALMSLAANLRLRMLLEDAVTFARSRKTGSQGVVPTEWADVAAPTTNGTTVNHSRNGWESAVSPHTDPLKCTLSNSNRLPTPISEGSKTPLGTQPYPNDVVKALRQIAKIEREQEEARLLKRQTRLSADGTPRQGSVAPGTPGSIAPEPTTKPLTKKEREKQDKGKQSLADSHAQANATTQQFLFGGGKKGRQYSWMTGGGAGSGASTPNRTNIQGLPNSSSTPGVGPEKVMLTGEGTNRMGQLREDSKFQGPLVEMRDFLAVLEYDSKAPKSLQMAYAQLDMPKLKKH